MGRPIKKSFFANLNDPYQDQATGGPTGVGGEGVASITVLNSGTLYTTSTTLNLTFSAPQIGGTSGRATGRVTTNAFGNVTSVTLTKAGSGYTVAPTATVNGGTTGTTATFTVALTTTRQEGISVSAWVTGGVSAKAADIMKQEGTVRYLVQNADGVGICNLVGADPAAAGEMNILATDVNGSSYYVTKLTSRKARLTRKAMVGSYEYATGDVTRWSLAAATTGTVSVSNA
jgi:hypothetical protein